MTQQPQARPAVLAVLAHPDDETLSAGALLALLARGCDVHLITANRGERGEVIGPPTTRTRTTPETTVALRGPELDGAAAALGLASHRYLDEVVPGGPYTDSGMVWADEARTLAAPAPDAGRTAFSTADLAPAVTSLGDLIAQVQPLAVITEEPGGGYGHPDHVRAHQLTVAALEAAGERWRVPVVAWAVRDAARLRTAQAWLRDHPDRPAEDRWGEPLTAPDPDGPQSSGAYERPDVVLDATPVLDRVLAAVAAYPTQMHELHDAGLHGEAAGWYAMSSNDLRPVLTHAAAALAAGTPAELAALAGAEVIGPEPQLSPPEEPTGWVRGLMFGFAVVLGVLAGLFTTAFHRYQPPVGLAVGLVALAAGGVLVRALGNRTAALWYGLAAVVGVLGLSMVSPGGDVLLPQDWVSLTWMALLVIGAALGAFAPAGWFRERR